MSWWLAVLGGCHAHGTDPPTDTPPATETGTPATGVTGHTGDTGATSSYPRPTAISASCDPTDNALRFVCHVTVDPPQPVQIRFARADGTGLARVHTSLLDTADHDVPLYFMNPHSDYTFTASAVGWPGVVATGVITTGNVPLELSAFLNVVGTSSTPYLGTNLSCGTGANGGVFDTESGELLWYQVADPTGQFGGYQMVQFTEAHTMLGQSGGEVTDIDLMGNDLLRKYEGADYVEDLHHDLFERDGLYYLLYHQGAVLLDGFLIWDANGDEVGRWFSADHLAIPGYASGDYMHTNTIYVRDGYAWLSSFQQSTVIKVDADLASPTFGDVQWLMGGTLPDGFGNDFAIDWSAVDGVDGFNHQHDVNLTADGRLLMLDNTHGRALVLDLDEASHTAVAEAAYPTTNAACGPQGTAMETAAGNFLVDCSSMTVREFEPGATTPVWSAELKCSNGTLGGGPSDSPERWYPLDGW